MKKQTNLSFQDILNIMYIPSYCVFANVFDSIKNAICKINHNFSYKNSLGSFDEKYDSSFANSTVKSSK